VNEAAADMASHKQDDLRRDASTDADKLRARLTDIVKFCLDVNKTNVFLVEGPNLREAEWGTEIQALADLRFIHQIGNISVQTGKYRGKKFLGFTLDLSNYTSTRSERSITQIEFWTTAGKQSVRRSSLIYELGASDRAPVRTGAATDVGEDLPGTWGDKQIDIFELLAEDAAKPPNSDA
jgi:hypothetical protein